MSETEDKTRNGNFEVSRRGFLTWAGFISGGLALPRIVRSQVLTPKQAPLPNLNSEAFDPALCKLCPAFCMLQIRTVDGKPVGVAGMPGHPISRGTHCPKGGAVLQDFYHPDRLRSPMKATGARGSGQWTSIGWDEAENIVGGKLSALLRQGRPENLAMITAPGKDIRHEISANFGRAFGSPNVWDLDWRMAQPPADAFKAMYGFSEGLGYDWLNARLIVSFGWDWLQAFESPVEAQRLLGALHGSRFGERTEIIQVEPRLSITAAKADQWIPIRPGTEGYLALGVAHTLIARKLYDESFARKWVSDFSEYEIVVGKYSPQNVSEICGVEATRIVDLARRMASKKSVLALTSRGSLFNQVAVHGLNVLMGSFGVRPVAARKPEEYRRISPTGKIPAPKAAALVDSAHELCEAILSKSESPIDVLWVRGANPVFQSPQPKRWIEALRKIPFIVSFPHYMDELSAMADLVLPTNNALESWQDGFSTTLDGSSVYSVTAPVVRPLYETTDYGDFVLKLANSMGGKIAAAFPRESVADLLKRVRMRTGIHWRESPAPKTGIAEILKGSRRASLAAASLRPEIKPKAGDDYPWRLCVYSPLAYSFGEGAHLPYLQSVASAQLGEQWETWIEIHPRTAGKLRIEDGVMVWIESAHGKIKARAIHYQGIREDTVAVPFGLGHEEMGRYARGIGSNPAVLVAAPLKNGDPSWQETCVRIYVA